MQIQIFTIPVLASESALEEMNKFLQSHRILDIREEFVSNAEGMYWFFRVRYTLKQISKSPNRGSKQKGEKKDYKEILDEATFQKFSALRVCRKEISKEEKVPAFVVFTDVELRKIAELSELNWTTLQKIKGIGGNRVEKYGQQLMKKYHKQLKDEKK